jgi:hypothetical protein
VSKQYYYLVSGLYDLVFDEEKQSVYVDEFLAFLDEELHPTDWPYIKLYLLANDNQNLLSLINQQDRFITPANYTRDFLETEFKNPSELPPYMQTFLEAYKAEEPVVPPLSWQDQLTAQYYWYGLTWENPFNTQWLHFEKDLRNLLAALNCRRYKLPLQDYLIGAWSGREYFVDQLTRSTAGDFGLGREYPWVEQVAIMYDRNVLIELEKEVDLIRWHKLDELNTFDYFSAEKVYGYFLKLMITDRWFKLIPEAGEEMFDKLVGKLKDSFVLAEEILA